MNGPEVVRLLRERADSYARDAEALRGSDPDAVVILTGMRDELRKVATEIGGWDGVVETMRGGLPGFDNTGRLHGAGCVDCDNGVQEFHRSRTDKPNRLRDASPTANCKHWGHPEGEWKYSCCACSGIPDGCANCTTDWD